MRPKCAIRQSVTSAGAFLLACPAKIGGLGCYLRREEEVMTYLVFGGVLAAMLSLPFVAISPMTRRPNSGQPVRRHAHIAARSECAPRYDACIETGCWKV